MYSNVGQLSVADLVDQIDRKSIVINKQYQRGSGIWPDSARTYFIDTMLEGYPFPKLYLYQVFNEKSRRPIKEIVDGQQRVTTIMDFMADKFALTSASNKYSGMHFSDLNEEEQQKFLSYQVEVSTIMSASRAELLEMFRRINAYTAPLSSAEKRHATYQGKFKWFIVEQADEHSPILEELGIFTAKQLARMNDAEFICDLLVAVELGIVSKSAKQTEDLYKKYDEVFDKERYFSTILNDFFTFLYKDIPGTHDTFLMKSYAIHSLFCAFVHIKYGLPNVEEFTDIRPNPDIGFDLEHVTAQLEQMADEHENQIEDGDYPNYVAACLSSTTKAPQRAVRFKAFVNVLSGNV
ncbi:DUF262 domain-containing protein [Shewanella indica]|uniref:DUF262 domain-containing protein n=1 Tax=Shewanella indica TaxID=768528 RepID=UPI001CFF1E4B|nr:DUF262 domain-containing protein [Shewanella indica]